MPVALRVLAHVTSAMFFNGANIPTTDFRDRARRAEGESPPSMFIDALHEMDSAATELADEWAFLDHHGLSHVKNWVLFNRVPENDTEAREAFRRYLDG